ncbi:hypothetical protein ACQKFU_23790 [Bacillus mycoides]|uniref:hypothetical protein n=1 Tax=Bacillus mycoides TaxID=1405 RepID=UPI003D07E797
MSFLNMPLKTLGGKVWWINRHQKSGWKLQQHILTNHYRILDPEDIRQAWGIDYQEIYILYLKIVGVDK